jgi:hypothetical protein
MNPNLIAIFDLDMHLRATLSWRGDRFTMDGVSGFNNDDVKLFLLWLNSHDPRKRLEINGTITIALIPKSDQDYRNAVWQELGIQGFSVYPIEEYQKDFLLELNDAKFDRVRKNSLGDLLAVSKADLPRFVEDLKEAVGIVRELNELE